MQGCCGDSCRPTNHPIPQQPQPTVRLTNSQRRQRRTTLRRSRVDAAYDDMREQLESDEPDATGRWDAEHRRKVLAYIYARDDGRCGVCAGEMKLSGAHVEHVVPKIFAVFDVRKGGKAEQGIRYTSRLHKLDNLQASHTYCNKRKGNTSDVKKWRHQAMPPLTVADADDGQFVVPYKRSTKSTKHK